MILDNVTYIFMSRVHSDALMILDNVTGTVPPLVSTVMPYDTNSVMHQLSSMSFRQRSCHLIEKYA